MSHLKGVLRAELQAQGMLGGPSGGGGGGGNGDTCGDSSGGGGASSGEGIFLNMLRRLENVDVAGEDSPTAAAAAAAAAEGTENWDVGCSDNGRDGGDCGEQRGGGGGERGRTGSSGSRGEGHHQEGASGVGSSFAGVGAKLRSKFRKPGGGFGLAQGGSDGGGGSGGGGGGGQTPTGVAAAEGAGEGGKAFVEGASKALAANRERVMGWMKELRPKDWSPKQADEGAEAESLQELRRAVRRLYLDAPDPAVHTAMVVARARPAAPRADAAAQAAKGEAEDAAAGAAVPATAVRGVDRVVGTGADRHLTKLVWFRSSSGGGFAEIKGVDGPYYQPSADDVGTRICVKCTLAGAALNFGGSGALSPAAGKGRRGRPALGGGGGGSRSPQSPQRHQAQVTFAEVGPIVLDPAVGTEVDKLLAAAEGPAVFEGLVRRDIPGEPVRVRVEIGAEKVRVLADPGSTGAARNKLGDEQGARRVGDSNGKAAAVTTPVETQDDAAVTEEGTPPSPTVGVGEDGGDGVLETETKDDSRAVAAAAAVGKCGDDGGNTSSSSSSSNLEGDVVVAEPTVSEVGGGREAAEAATAAVEAADEAVVLAEGTYSSGVLVGLDPARPDVLKLTIGGRQRAEAAGGGNEAPTVLLLGAVDGRQRDVLALTLRGHRLAARSDVAVDDYPEETMAHQEEEDYLELKAAAAHFASAYDEDGVSATETTGSEDDDDDDDDDYDDDDEEGHSGSHYDTSEDDGEEVEEESAARSGSKYALSSVGGGVGGGATTTAATTAANTAANTAATTSATSGTAGTARGSFSSATAAGGPQGRGVVGAVEAASWETIGGSGAEGGEGDNAGDEPRSLSTMLEELRQARAVADARGRQLKEAHSRWEAGDASRQRAEAELSLVSSELDLLRPFSRSLAARAEGKESAEARAASLEAEVETLRGQLAAAVESAEKLGSRAGTAEDEAGASASKLSGLEKVVRRLGGEAEVAHADLAKERSGNEEATARASKAERELDQARARAAVLDNKLAALEKEKMELLADANASKARAGALEEKFSAARVAESAEYEARVSELEEQVSRLEAEKTDAASRMEEALSKKEEAEARAKAAVKAEEEARAEMADKAEQVMRLTAQRNSAKSRADSLAKDLSRVCGGGRTLDQIEIIVTKYADLKVKMATMEAERDGAADLKDDWESDAKGQKGEKGGRKVSEAAKRALRENTELHGRVAAMAESLQMRAHQVEGQRQSNEFLLKRVEELERQVATTSGKMAIGTD
ncbi:unnamed protein product [Pylaiella littoralis]